MKRKIIPALIAGLSNVALPSLGYFYAGAWRLGLAICIGIVLGGIALFRATLQHPPGVYGPWPTWTTPLGWALALVLAVHAAWLRVRRSPTQPMTVRLLTGALAIIAVAASAFVFRAFWPQSVYRVSTASLEPHLHQGDLVAVQGARAICGRARPATGDVVIVAAQGPHRKLIRAVAAAPGEAIATRNGSVRAASDTWLIADDAVPSGYRATRQGEICGVAYKVLQSGEHELVGQRPQALFAR